MEKREREVDKGYIRTGLANWTFQLENGIQCYAKFRDDYFT